tara:strand:+ start:164 stop:433 length:270 start_codon:yes stop_codon:yes gene_type:complete
MTIIVLTACGDNTTSKMTEQLVKYKEQMVACDTLKTCTTASFEYATYIGHPDTAKVLAKCEKNNKCYEAMMDITTYLFTDHLAKLMAVK